MSQANWKIVSKPSPAAAQANRLNAQSSTGPRTAAGKAASAKNALTHGLTSKQVVLDTEDASAFDSFRSDLERSWLPVGERERCAFDEYVTGLWRLQRCRRTEAAVLDNCIDTLTRDNRDLTPDQALALVFTEPIYQKKMSLFLRYQSSIERAVNRAQKELTHLQKDRREEEAAVLPVFPPRATAAGRDFESFDRLATPVNIASSCTITPPAETIGLVLQL